MTSAPGVQGVSAPHRGNKSRWSTTAGSVASQSPAHGHHEITTPWSPAGGTAQRALAPADVLLQGTKTVPTHSTQARNRMREEEEKSGGTKKAPETHFQVFPSTSGCCNQTGLKFVSILPCFSAGEHAGSPTHSIRGAVQGLFLSPLPLTILIFYYFSLEETCK